MKWTIKDTDRWFDFKGFLFGKGFKNITLTYVICEENNYYNGMSVAYNVTDETIVTNNDDTLRKLVGEYLSSLPEECKSDIKCVIKED